jgi:hypothetical protein
VTILTLRRIREDRFEVTGPDNEPVTFKTRVEARDWCLTHYQGSPIREVGGRKRGTPKATVATAELAEILERRPDLKGKSIEAVRRILRREARLSLSPQKTSKTREWIRLHCRCSNRSTQSGTAPALYWCWRLQAEFLKFGAKVHEGGDWHQPFEQGERVK